MTEKAYLKKKLELEDWLSEARKGSKRRIEKRLKAVWIYHYGHTKSPQKIAVELESSRSRVLQWLRDYRLYGIKGLLDRQIPGRPAQLNKTQRQELKKLILKNPRQLGFSKRIWDWEILDELIQNKFSISYHPGHLRRILNQHRRYIQRSRIKDIRMGRKPMNKWQRKDSHKK